MSLLPSPPQGMYVFMSPLFFSRCLKINILRIREGWTVSEKPNFPPDGLCFSFHVFSLPTRISLLLTLRPIFIVVLAPLFRQSVVPFRRNLILNETVLCNVLSLFFKAEEEVWRTFAFSFPAHLFCPMKNLNQLSKWFLALSWLGMVNNPAAIWKYFLY